MSYSDLLLFGIGLPLAVVCGVSAACTPCGGNMLGTITPVVCHRRSKALWLLNSFLFLLGALVSATFFGSILGLAGRVLIPTENPALAWITIAVLAAAYSLHELGVYRLPTPQLKWQVPAGWRVTLPLWLTSFLYGALLGPGAFTYVYTASYYVLLGLIVAMREPFQGAFIMQAYAVGLFAPIFAVGCRVDSIDSAFAYSTRLFRSRGIMNMANGAILAVISVCAVAGVFTW